ncbi:hypothetical protein D3C85_1208520 [compost metagenome]
MFLDACGHLLRGAHEDQVAAAGDLGKTLFDVSGRQGFATAIGMHHVGGHALGLSRQCLAVGVAADIDTGVARVAHQLRL